MPKETLKRQMQELHEELASVPSVDVETGSELRRVLGDIKALLDRSEDADAPEEKHPIRDRLTDAARGLEASHPKAFSLIREIVDTLAQAGI